MKKTLCLQINPQDKGLRNVKESKENKCGRGRGSNGKMKGNGKIKMSICCRKGLLYLKHVRDPKNVH